MKNSAFATLLFAAIPTMTSATESTTDSEAAMIRGVWQVVAVERDATFDHGQTGRQVDDRITIRPERKVLAVKNNNALVRISLS